MRIAIDLQAVQSDSRFRGIGRYAMGLAEGIVRNRGNHDIFLVLNGSLPESVQTVRENFAGLLPPENIVLWYTPLPLKYFEWGGMEHHKIGSILQSFCTLNLKPDVVLFCTLLGDFCDTFTCDLNRLQGFTRMATVFYDLIPYRDPDRCLGGKESPVYQRYMDLFDQMRHIDLFFPISNHAKSELRTAIKHGEVKTIFSDTDSRFKKIDITDKERKYFLERFGIEDGFVLYTGGNDERKNIPTLLTSHQNLPETLRKRFPLVVIEGKNTVQYESRFTEDPWIYFFDYLSDKDLLYFYNLCTLFVFPSLEEGFGLPPLEAMRCGAPVLTSNATSLPEVVELEEALFDPRDINNLTGKLQLALTDMTFRELLLKNGEKQQKKFSWDLSARWCLESMEQLPPLESTDLGLAAANAAREAIEALHLEGDELHVAMKCFYKTFSNVEYSYNTMY